MKYSLLDPFPTLLTLLQTSLVLMSSVRVRFLYGATMPSRVRFLMAQFAVSVENFLRVTIRDLPTMKPIYLDYNATTPVDPAVAEEMLPYLFQHFGNPSSSHLYGKETRSAIETARARVAAILGCAPPEIIFTSGASESNNTV